MANVEEENKKKRCGFDSMFAQDGQERSGVVRRGPQRCLVCGVARHAPAQLRVRLATAHARNAGAHVAAVAAAVRAWGRGAQRGAGPLLFSQGSLSSTRPRAESSESSQSERPVPAPPPDPSFKIRAARRAPAQGPPPTPQTVGSAIVNPSKNAQSFEPILGGSLSRECGTSPGS